MDSSGKNRFQLLCMDDDAVVTVSSDNLIDSDLQKKKSQSNSVHKKSANGQKSKDVQQKENKSTGLYRNDAISNIKVQKSKSDALPFVQKVAVVNLGLSGYGDKVINNENYGQKHSNKAGIGGREPNDDRQHNRQYKDREYRAPTRYRSSEGGFRNGKREFDRQSGSDKTGVKPIDKRDGAGAHNWGSAKQYIDDINNSNIDIETTLIEKADSANEQNAEQTVIPEEDETKEFTLDEWKALRNMRTKPQYNLRKAGEGEDTAQWKKMVVLSKKKDYDSEEELEYDPSMYPQRVGRLQRIVDIQFNFNDNRRNGLGRGRGRGTRANVDRSRYEDGRNGGGASGERSYVKTRSFAGKQAHNGQLSLRVDDERQFPTLC